MRNTAVGVIVVLLIAFCALFALQNSSRETQLSLNLGFTAWRLEKPVSIPLLIGISFGAGLLAGASLGLVRIVRLGSRVRELEQQATLRQFSSSTSTSQTREPGAW